MKKIFGLLFLIVSFSVNARPMDSGPFSLEGGVIQPAQDVYILDASKLPGALYVITCNLLNPAYQKAYPAVLRISANGGDYGNIVIKVNGKDIKGAANQAVLNQPTNILEVSGISNVPKHYEARIIFHNFDSTDAITVSNCMARYQTA